MGLDEVLFTGARAELKIDGITVGHMTNVSATRTFQNVRLQECGSPIDTAISTVGVSVDLTADGARIVGPSEDAQAKGLVPRFNAADIIQWPEVNALIKDNITGAIIGKVIGCKISSEGIVQTGARAYASSNLRWEARGFQHGSEV